MSKKLSDPESEQRVTYAQNWNSGRLSGQADRRHLEIPKPDTSLLNFDVHSRRVAQAKSLSGFSQETEESDEYLF